MTDRPILFSGPMVRALLDGRKTQTRRIVKPQPFEIDGEWWIDARKNEACRLDDYVAHRIGCPPYHAGDRLWVKESGLHKRGPLFELFIHDATPDRYWASPDHRGERLTPEARGKRGAGIGPALTRDQHKAMGFKARPSIHMPRWASRLTLEITDVRVERLQDITWDDAIAEGIEPSPDDPGLWRRYGARAWDDQGVWMEDPCGSYETLWSDINGPDSWAANPWVWVVTFDVERP